jgi:hypothetical protein
MRPEAVLGNRNGTKRLWNQVKIGGSVNFAERVWFCGHASPHHTFNRGFH